MLTISLRKLSRGPVEERGRVALHEEPWSSTELAFEQPPAYELLARESGDGVVHVTGSLHAEMRLTCRRCLGAVNNPVHVEVDWLFDPGLDGVADEPSVFRLDRDEGSLDLAPQVREEMILAAPAYPLCDADCQGLCPKCGTDLNEDSCDCTHEEVDPRWDKLRQLESS